MVTELSGVPIQDGTIPFIIHGDTLSTWYLVVGSFLSRTKPPLVVLHGGPGLTHDYLIPLADLAVDRPVILYDQIGNGRSSYAADKPASFWTIDLMIDELVNLLRHFNIEDDFDVLGHSWGAQLLAKYLIRRSPAGLKHAVFSNPLCDEQAYRAGQAEQLKQLPQWVQDGMRSKELEVRRRAMYAYGAVHFCRVSPPPPEFVSTIEYGLKHMHVWDSLYVSTPHHNDAALILTANTALPANYGNGVWWIGFIQSGFHPWSSTVASTQHKMP
jgi:proline-specific peptidase